MDHPDNDPTQQDLGIVPLTMEEAEAFIRQHFATAIPIGGQARTRQAGPDTGGIVAVETVDPVAVQNLDNIVAGIDAFMENISIRVIPVGPTVQANSNAKVDLVNTTITVEQPPGLVWTTIQERPLRKLVTSYIFNEAAHVGDHVLEVRAQGLVDYQTLPTQQITCRHFTAQGDGHEDYVSQVRVVVGDKWDFDKLHPESPICTNKDIIASNEENPNATFTQCTVQEGGLLHEMCTGYSPSVGTNHTYVAEILLGDRPESFEVSTIRMGQGSLGIMCDDRWSWMDGSFVVLLESVEATGGTVFDIVDALAVVLPAKMYEIDDVYESFFEGLVADLRVKKNQDINFVSFGRKPTESKRGSFINHANR